MSVSFETDNNLNQFEIYGQNNYLDKVKIDESKIEKSSIKKQILEAEKSISTISTNEIDTGYTSNIIDLNNIDAFISILEEKLEQGKLIGYDLLQIAGNSKIKNIIHSEAIKYLRINYIIKDASKYLYRDRIVISLILIALDYYDGNYWDHVRNMYVELYAECSQQKMDATIRKILAYYSKGENRYINFVIRQAITPKFFLSDFISFAFDIYKNIFKYNLMENMTDPLANVFIDLNKNYINENGEIGTKDNTYKLIKTTKEIINNINWFGELIAYTTIVLQYIDINYWNDDNNKTLPYSDFFDKKIKEWIEDNKKIFFVDRKRNSIGKRNIWNAAYELKSKNVYLYIPDHLINAKYDPYTIKLKIYDGDKLIKFYEKPEIIKVFGGFQLKSRKVNLSNPIGKIRYEILSNDTLIYSSKEKLHRDYILFNEKHNEIKCGTKYIGNIDVVLKKESVCGKLDYYFSNEIYKIGSCYIEEYTSFKIDNDNVYFTLLEHNQIIGNKYDGVFIRTKNHLNPIYNRVEQLVFVSNVAPENLRLQINEQFYHLNDIEIINLNNRFICKMNLAKIINNGFNYVKITNIITNEVIFNNLIFIDNNYKCDFKIDDDNVVIDVESIFIRKSNYICNFNLNNPFELEFASKYFAYPLFLVPKVDVPIYRIDDNKWKLFSNLISIKDIEAYSKIWIYGLNFDFIKLVEVSSKKVIDITHNISQGKYFITPEKIRQYIDSEITNIDLVFFENGIAKEKIQVFYKVVLDSRTFEAKYDEENKEFVINFSFFGKDVIHLELMNRDNIVYKTTIYSSPVQLKLKELSFFKNYNLLVTCGENDLFSLNTQKYTVLEKNIIFCSTQSLIGQKFEIRKCWGEIYDREKNEWKDIYKNIKNKTVYLEIKNQLDDDLFLGDLIVKRGEREESLEVELLLTSEISEGKMWGCLKSEGDLLLYNFEVSSIIIDEDLATKHDMPISEYKFYYEFEENTLQ